ncbi:hypothetical protein [Hyphomicrobium sp.]|uniref:hypothetical protein n=1 Tax=Hyphomicrobium sp. TaxID=82 RepID=UPI0025BF4F5D|nr:hypothetical protein [Hyphomicrobium sp.]MCC7251120.1 hypothetical protein [Hyphomicrobium sp.]
MRASVLLVIAGLLCVAGYLLTLDHGPETVEPGRKNVEHAAPADDAETKPQLYCIFFGYGRQPRLEFLFNVDRDDRLRFRQLYLIEINGSQRSVDAKQPPFPEWTFDTTDNPSRLRSEIKVFDNTAAGFHMETITIEIYGYQPETAARQEFEAGLKNIHYQNLPGQCTNVQVRRH